MHKYVCVYNYAFHTYIDSIHTFDACYNVFKNLHKNLIETLDSWKLFFGNPKNISMVLRQLIDVLAPQECALGLTSTYPCIRWDRY